MIIIVVFGARPVGPDQGLPGQGRDRVLLARAWTSSTPRARRRRAVTYKFNWLPAAGTLLLICGLLTMVVLRDLAPRARCAPTGAMLNQLKWATLTVAAVLGARLRDEPVARRRWRSATGSPARAACWRSSRRSSAGSARR